MLKQFIRNAMLSFMEKDLPFTTNLPSQGRATLMLQKEEKRYVAHALYANTILRGLKADSFAPHTRATGTVEVIEELNPCCNVTFSFRVPEKITSVTLEPQGKEIPFEEKDGVVTVKLDSFICHQMIVLHFA